MSECKCFQTLSLPERESFSIEELRITQIPNCQCREADMLKLIKDQERLHPKSLLTELDLTVKTSGSVSNAIEKMICLTYLANEGDIDVHFTTNIGTETETRNTKAETNIIIKSVASDGDGQSKCKFKKQKGPIILSMSAKQIKELISGTTMNENSVESLSSAM